MPLNTLGMNWNADCKASHCQTPVPDLTDTLVSEWEQIHISNIWKPSQKSIKSTHECDIGVST